MGRLSAILAVWLGGFLLGFIAYLSYPYLTEALLSIIPFLFRLDAQLIGAIVAGVATSFVTIVIVMIWAYTSKSSARLS